MTTNKDEIRGVARHLRLVCTEQVEELEVLIGEYDNKT